MASNRLFASFGNIDLPLYNTKFGKGSTENNRFFLTSKKVQEHSDIVTMYNDQYSQFERLANWMHGIGLAENVEHPVKNVVIIDDDGNLVEQYLNANVVLYVRYSMTPKEFVSSGDETHDAANEQILDMSWRTTGIGRGSLPMDTDKLMQAFGLAATELP